jgi:probable F420-dependent oxidoreductase
MRVEMSHYAATLDDAAAVAARAEALGYDGWWSHETQIDAALACVAAAERTERIRLGTGIMVAFGRNPMTVAVQGNDIQGLSKGRFALGLGSQIKPHITRRYSMPWSRPAARMNEFIAATRAIWQAWATGEKLDFRGDFYTHTLMTPFFDPGPNPHGPPPIILAAVGPRMTAVAGEAADGIIAHGFTTERYLREKTLPALTAARERVGKTLQGFEIAVPAFVAAQDSEEKLAAEIEMIRGQIAFYGSTPAYRPVLEVHGWGELQTELHAMTVRGAWDQAPKLVDDEVLHTFGVIGTPEEAVAELKRRYGDFATSVRISPPDGVEPKRWRRLLAELRAA